MDDELYKNFKNLDKSTINSIDELSSPLNKCMAILQLAEDEFSEDYLSVSMVEKCLHEIGVPLSNKQISNAVSRAGKKIAKKKSKKPYQYKISVSGRKDLGWDSNFSSIKSNDVDTLAFESLLHPVVMESSLEQFKNKHYRNAVLDAFIAIFEFIRKRTNLDLDGSGLATQVFGVNDPMLVFSNISTESGKNDQKGFMQIFQGAFTGIRNPKAHTIKHSLDEVKAAQYLIFASLLARRVDEAKLVKHE